MMNTNAILASLLLIAALGSGLVAGVFFAFSSFVMKALGKLPTEKAIAAMQSINIVVINPGFLGVFIGTAALCLPALFFAWQPWDSPDAGWLLAGSLLYLVGGVIVTGMFNIPRNDALAAVDPASAEGAELWRDYLATWTMWNHVRAAACLAAAAAFIIGLRQVPSTTL